MYDLIIQIVNYKTKKYLGECLTTLLADLKNSTLKYAIFILDNDSGDNLSDLEKKYRGHGKISFYASEKNLGFGAGHNVLSKKAKSRYILILNPDVKFIEEKTTERLYKRITENPKIKVVGPQLITKEGNVQWWDHGELHGLVAFIALNTGSSYWRKRNNLSKVAWVSGAVFLVEREIFENLEGFDEKFFLYKEEEELCWRIRKRGGKIIYDPSITVFHYGGVVGKKSDHQENSVQYFIDKHLRRRTGYRIFKLVNRVIHRVKFWVS